jgi:hypothetical protein
VCSRFAMAGYIQEDAQLGDYPVRPYVPLELDYDVNSVNATQEAEEEALMAELRALTAS